MSSRAWLSLAITAALWGASYLFIKVALDDGVSEGVIIDLRVVLGALILVPVAIRAGAVAPLLARRGWVLLLALVQVIAPFGLITFGENHVPSALAGILVGSSPLFIALLAARLDPEERARGWGLVGILLGMVGVVLLFGVDLSGKADALLGGLMILAAGLCYAAAVLVAKRAFTGVPPVGVAASTMVVSAVAWLPVALLTLPDHVPGANATASLLALGVGGTGVAFWLYYRSIADVGPARAAIVSYVAPAFAVVYGVTLLGERLTAGTIGGLVLILAGSWLAAQGRPPALSRSGPSRSSVPAPARVR
ncbi:DMT family transporter [Baekduia soli]|uniref:DMT family transporter n=1 Tax=Baekduia soli TaxID=496014 RepID=UPI0016524F3F|nr:DMT family transporter [Baekduia soli]